MINILLFLIIGYICSHIIKGDNMQLIFVKSVAFIFLFLTLSIAVLKFTNPSILNNDNLAEMISIIKSMAFLIVGFLFGNKK